MFRRITIVGVGLIGGSIGLAAKRRGVAQLVRGVGRHEGSLDKALEMGCVDEASLDLDHAGQGADLVVFCTPVDMIVAQVLRCARNCQPGTIITDAGSTKAEIVRGIEDHLPAGVDFVGSHPLAGSEKKGPQFADGGLFENRVTVLTPTDRTHAETLSRIEAFWQALGSRTWIMSPQQHDEALALTSHLPHVVASALAGLLPDEWRPLTAGGYRDTTRIAGSDPSLWSAIFLANQAAVLEVLANFESRLGEFRQALEGGRRTALEAWLAEAKRRRDGLN